MKTYVCLKCGNTIKGDNLNGAECWKNHPAIRMVEKPKPQVIRPEGIESQEQVHGG